MKPGDDEDARREANRQFFRAVNELLIDEPAAGKAGVAGDWRFLCECGSRTCASRLEIDAGEFVRLLRFSGGRVVAPGHERPGQKVIVAAPNYVVVSDPED